MLMCYWMNKKKKKKKLMHHGLTCLGSYYVLLDALLELGVPKAVITYMVKVRGSLGQGPATA